MSSASSARMERVSVFKFPIDRLDEAVQDPSFRLLLDQGWRVVITWGVEDDRARGSVSAQLMVVLAPPVPITPMAPTTITVEAPARPHERLYQLAHVAGLVLLAAALLVQALT